MESEKTNIVNNNLIKWLNVVVIPVAVFLIAFGAVAWRNNLAPDIFTDEIDYTRVSTRIAGEGALVWDSGDPFMIHPPLYFLLESAYLSLTGNPQSQVLNPGNIYIDVYHARLLNAFIAGLTAVVLFWISKRIRGTWPGLLIVALFIIDPFGVRINRRAMMETFSGLITFAGMGFFAINLMNKNPKYSWSIWAGLLLGAGMLSKEVTVISLLAVALFGAWELVRAMFFFTDTGESRFATCIHALLTFTTALLTYAIYPLWVISEGLWGSFWAEKFLGVQRLLGLIQITGWNRPGVSLSQFLLARLTDYGSSYILLALGAAATLWILINHNHAPQGRFVASWGMLLYPFFGFTALAGSGNDQLFYYLLVPAIFFVGYALSLPAVFTRFHRHLDKLRLGTAALILLVMIPYDAYRWVITFGKGQDNGYYQLAQYVRANLPAGVPINASGDAIKFSYFFPDHPITTVATPQQALAQGVHYYVLAPKDVQSHYGNITPQMEALIKNSGITLDHLYGNSYGDIYLYEINFQGGKTTAQAEVSGAGTGNWRTIHPAESNFVSPLIALMLLWLLLAGGVFSLFVNRYFDTEAWRPAKGVDHVHQTRRV